ncbi:hypothetical protein MBLNU457_5304t1 [Dothideomycetes sp. NU457]
MYTTTILLPLFAALPALSAPTTRNAPSTFSALSLRSGSAIQYAPIDANGTYFKLSSGSSTYCPTSNANINCSAYTSNETRFAGGNDTLCLHTAVPGGQQVYIDRDGALRFTQAHSAAMDGGSGVGFGFSADGSELLFDGAGFAACPYGTDDALRVYSTKHGVSEDCEGFGFFVVANPGAPAWEYN